MSDSNAVAIREGSSDLHVQLMERRREARSLELQVSRKEAELRRAKEEQALLKELHTVNEVALLNKNQQEDVEINNRLKISPESLQEVIALEDAIKHENKRTSQLQNTAMITSRQMEEVERGIEEISNRLTLIKQATGWDGSSAIGEEVALAANEWIMRKKSLTELHEEQKTVKSIMSLLNERIDTLNNQLKAQSQKSSELTKAQEILREKNSQYETLMEELKSMERLTKKKERLLDAASSKQCDDYKILKLLEGDKKVLYNTLSKFRETKENNSKSILSLEVRLRQIETKLEAVNLFLQQVFSEVEEEEPMENVPEDAKEVPLRKFEELCSELDHSRETLIERDDRLNLLDAEVEQLERKTMILQNAIASRATLAQLQVKGKEKEFETLMSHVDYMKTEFDEEYTKLSQENAALRSKLTQIHSN